MTKINENTQIDGISVIEQLDVNQLKVGTHQFWFQAATNALQQWQYLPLWIFKGSKPGKRIFITAAVHGDEYNGVLTAHQIIRQLQQAEISGTIVVVPTFNLSGMLHHSRDFFSSDPDVSDGNLNRHFPGNPNGNEPQRYIDAIWQGLMKDNADLAIDLHTQTSGTVYPLYLFADFRLEDALTMARLMQPDAILNDPGEAGVLETVWNQHQIPSITVEIGIGRYTETELVNRATKGVFRIFQHYGNIENSDSVEISPCDIETSEVTSVRAFQGGFIMPCVQLMQRVEQNEIIAHHYNSFGQLTHTYTAPRDGVVLSHNVESMRAAGALVVRLIH